LGSTIAILIADSEVEPFPEIKIAQERYIQFLESITGVNVFYFRGQGVGKNAVSASNFLEKVRYSKARHLLQMIDFLVLYRHNIRIPSAQSAGRQIEVNVPEGLRSLGPKFLATLQFLSESKYDFYYKTTLSSIAHINLILNTLAARDPEEHLYAGPIVNVKNKQFVSGSSLLLSRKTANFLLENKLRWNHGKLDDVAIGNLLRKNVPITAMKSKSFSNIQEVAAVSIEEFLEVHHYRCKSNLIPRQDVAILKSLVERLVESKILGKECSP
jgi:hypothetical protein